MPTYARREGGAYARGGKLGWVAALAGHLRGLVPRPQTQRSDAVAAAEFLAHRDIEAGRAIDHLGAERPHQRRLLLLRFELDEADDARGAAVVHQPEAVHRTVGRAQLQHSLR